MANTFTQIYIQVVFAVQGSYSLIGEEHKEELHQYITGIVRNKKQKLIAINSNGLEENSIGRKDSARFLMGIHK